MKALAASLDGFTAARVFTSEADFGSIEEFPTGCVFLDTLESEVETTSGSGYGMREQTVTVIIAASSGSIEQTLLDYALAMEKAVYQARKNGEFPSGVGGGTLAVQEIYLSPESSREGHITQSFQFNFTQQLTV